MLGASVAASRVLGVLREAVFASVVGAGAEADAYRAAFLIPDILNHLLAGGALSVAFIPFYARKLRESGIEGAERVLASVMGTLGLAVTGATALLWWQAEALVAGGYGWGGGYPPEVQERIVYLTRILLPAQVFFVMGGVVRGVLMAHDRFASQAAAGVVYNLGIILGGFCAGAEASADGFAWGALVGAFLGPFLTAVLELRWSKTARLRARVAPLDREFLEYLWLAAPLMIGLGMLTVDDWYNKLFGARIGEGAVALLGYGRQLMLTPVGVIGQSIAIAALPTLSALWARRQLEELNALVLGTLQSGLGLALLAGAVTFVLADPLVVLVFQRGRFSAEDGAAVAQLLRVFSFAVPGWVLSQILPRPFYAREDMWRPMLLGTAVAAAMAPLYWVLGQRFGAPGLAAAGALGMAMSSGALLGLARLLHGGPDLGAFAGSALRSTGIAALVGTCGWVTPVPDLTGLIGAGVEIVLRGGVMGAVALVGVHLLGDPATRRAMERIVRRLGIRRG